MRPTSAVSVSLAMPTTTVMKMIGAISIRTSATKASPKGFICLARSGAKWPSATPMTTATSTCRYSDFD